MKIKPLEFDILATGSNMFYGIDENVQDAITRCKRGGGRKPFIITIVPKGTEVNGLNVTYPRDATFSATKIGTI